jgi:hypothetical protein
MQEHIVRDKVESIRKIRIYSISLTLTADNRSQEVEKCHQVGNCRFSSGEAMLILIIIIIIIFVLQSYKYYVSFEVFTAVIMKNAVLGM